MGKSLEKKRKQMENRCKNFEKLSKCRNMDFPDNLTHICKINLDILNIYYENKIKGKLNYKLKYDYMLSTVIYNFLASLKSYLNRKKKDIEKRVPNDNKKDIIAIFEKYWKASRKQTTIDKLIIIRDRMEHNKITSGVILNRTYREDYIEDHLMVDNIEIIPESNNAFNELKKLNEEIGIYIEQELSKLRLRESCLFLNAFNRRFNIKPFTQLIPEETDYEIKLFDEEIERLLNIKDD